MARTKCGWSWIEGLVVDSLECYIHAGDVKKWDNEQETDFTSLKILTAQCG